jgi:hypothetical protein
MAIVGIISGLVLVKHQQNILRLISGTEYRFGSSSKKALDGAPNPENDAV